VKDTDAEINVNDIEATPSFTTGIPAYSNHGATLGSAEDAEVNKNALTALVEILCKVRNQLVKASARLQRHQTGLEASQS